MALPFLQSYNDPKLQKAYKLYLGGMGQRPAATKAKCPLRSLARYCKNDGWEAERKARQAAASSPDVAAVAAVAAERQPATSPAATHGSLPQPPATGESRAVRMDRVLDRQQRIVGRLVDAFERDVDRTLTAVTDERPLSRSQIAQLTSLGTTLMAMERKAWGVPDKIETKDTTPQKVDPVREMTDEQLDRRERELDQQLAAAEGRTGQDRAGKAAAESVH